MCELCRELRYVDLEREVYAAQARLTAARARGSSVDLVAMRLLTERILAIRHVQESIGTWPTALAELAARESGHDTEGPLPDERIPYRLAEGLDLVPRDALEAVGRVFAHGASKHSPHGWRSIARGYHYGKAASHMHEYLRDVSVDADSGEHPLAHAAARLLMVLALELEAER